MQSNGNRTKFILKMDENIVSTMMVMLLREAEKRQDKGMVAHRLTPRAIEALVDGSYSEMLNEGASHFRVFKVVENE